MNYKALALDLDGTLLTSNNTISDKTKEALIELQERGVKVILASGRPTYGMKQFSEELLLDLYDSYLLSFNGGQMIKVKGMEILSEKTLEVEMIHHLYEEALRQGVGLIVYEKDKLLCLKPNEYTEIESRITGMPIVEITNKNDIKEKSVKCLMTENPDKIQSIESRIADIYQDSLAVYRSAPFFLELVPKGIDKGARLRELVHILDINPSEIVACGDGYNDKTLIEAAGVGVAMGNAVPEIKAIADDVTKSNDEDGIVDIIHRYF